LEDFLLSRGEPERCRVGGGPPALSPEDEVRSEEFEERALARVQPPTLPVEDDEPRSRLGRRWEVEAGIVGAAERPADVLEEPQPVERTPAQPVGSSGSRPVSPKRWSLIASSARTVIFA
jgi:hypothetical protein